MGIGDRCTGGVGALVGGGRVGPGCSMPVGPVVVARVGSCRRRWTSVALAGGPSAGIVSHRCSLSMCTCAVAALVERVRVGRSVPGTRYRLPVGPVVVARVGSCCARVGLCRASVADAILAACLLGCIAAVCL